ncbi:MAG: hypothetical protein FJZ00_05995, partial [Candidatus Sericytochromatia bacterium]|nr:hypothetical protein [Candidatus Tanganyikabacteria bacterium]
MLAALWLLPLVAAVPGLLILAAAGVILARGFPGALASDPRVGRRGPVVPGSLRPRPSRRPLERSPVAAGKMPALPGGGWPDLPFPIGPVGLLAAGLLISTAISVALSIDRSLSWPNLVLAGAYLLTIWVVATCFAEEAALEKALAALFWGMIPWAAIGIVFSLGKFRWDADWGPIQVHLGTWDHRANSILLHPNILSGHLIFAIAAGLAAARGRWALFGPGLAIL